MREESFVFKEGWYGLEADDRGEYRWMAGEAVLESRHPMEPGRKYLRITAGHSFAGNSPPVLSVTVNGTRLGTCSVEPSFSTYAFPFEAGGNLRLELRLDRTSRVPGDPRDLGIMVREIALIPRGGRDAFLEGWYLPDPAGDLEEEPAPRWMKKEASCLLHAPGGKEPRLLRITAGHAFPGAENPKLRVFVGGAPAGEEMEVTSGKMDYVLPLPTPAEDHLVRLTLNRTFSGEVSRDSRDLGILVRKMELVSPRPGETVYGEGWFGWESGEFFPFRWMGATSKAYLPPEALDEGTFIGFFAFSEFTDLSQKLTLVLDGEPIGEIQLLHHWNYYSVAVGRCVETNGAEKGRGELILTVNKLFPEKYHPQDPRRLGLRVGRFEFHRDLEVHRKAVFFHENALLNYREMTSGKTELRSYPLHLGIDLFGKCNIKPPCVYCLWDWTKEWEGEFIDRVVDEKTFEEYGPFFYSSRLLINCSIGEPLLHPRLKEVLDFCERHKKILEISTNGQAFTERTIRALVGKPVYLYVSLDAASKETYAKIRNDRWDAIIPNLVRLNEERKKKGNLPKIHMVFMPMKVNKHELEDYFRLCRKVDADALIIRPLLILEKPGIEEHRGGYHFVYEEEMLSPEELEEIFLLSEEYAEKYGVPVANQFTFGMDQEEEVRKGSRSRPEKPHF